MRKLMYPFFIALYLAVGLAAHNKLGVRFMPGRRGLVLTNYGIFSGIGAFIAALMLSQCDISAIVVGVLVVMPVVLRYLLCHQCLSWYGVTLMYAFVVPVAVMFYSCADVAVIVTALAISTAFGRLGCICAGCCEGPETACDDVCYVYDDPEQLVNTTKSKDRVCCKPTLVYETIAQFVIAGLCMRFPAYAPAIYGVGTALLVLATELYRKRVDVRTTAVILLLLPFACGARISDVCAGSQSPNVSQAVVLAVAVAIFLSNDVMR